jgi:hypothetical protein
VCSLYVQVWEGGRWGELVSWVNFVLHFVFDRVEMQIWTASSYARTPIKHLQKIVNKTKHGFLPTKMKMCSLTPRYILLRNDMFGDQCKNNKIWWCLEHLDFVIIYNTEICCCLWHRFFLHVPLHVPFLGYCWPAIRTHIYVHCTDHHMYLFVIVCNTIHRRHHVLRRYWALARAGVGGDSA